MITDPISDMVVRIKNAQAAKAERVMIPYSKMRAKIAEILKDNGYVGDIEKRSRKAKKAEHDWLDIALKYSSDGAGAISGAKMISRLSRRMYIKAKEIKPVQSGYGIALISTPMGVMSSVKARKEGLGGEVLFEIW